MLVAIALKTLHSINNLIFTKCKVSWNSGLVRWNGRLPLYVPNFKIFPSLGLRADFREVKQYWVSLFQT